MFDVDMTRRTGNAVSSLRRSFIVADTIALATCAPSRKGVQSSTVNAFLTATTSLGVFQPWPLPSSRLASPKNSGCHDHRYWLRSTCRPATASPSTIPRNASAQINQAAGHAIIWGGTVHVRHDAQDTRDRELSVAHRNGNVCEINDTLNARDPANNVCAVLDPGGMRGHRHKRLAQFDPVVRASRRGVALKGLQETV